MQEVQDDFVRKVLQPILSEQGTQSSVFSIICLTDCLSDLRKDIFIICLPSEEGYSAEGIFICYTSMYTHIFVKVCMPMRGMSVSKAV